MDDAMFTGLVVVIINGGCNIGRDMALEYTKHGAELVVHGSKQVVALIVEEIEFVGGKGLAVNDDPIEAAFEKYKRIDVVVVVTLPGTAGESFGDRMKRMTQQTHPNIMDGYTCLSEQGSGSLLLMLDTEVEGAGCDTERMALIGLCKSLANVNESIKCNCIAPVGKKSEINASLVALALTSPSWAYSGSVVEAKSTFAQHLTIDEDVTYKYSSDQTKVDPPIEKRLPEPIMSVMKGRVAIVTGAGGGLGLMVARRLLELGARVVAYESNMMLRDVPQLGKSHQDNKTKRPWIDNILFKSVLKSEKKDDRHLFVNSMSEEEVVRTCIEKFGRVDILINCASVPTRNGLYGLSPFYWELMTRHHLEASYCMSQLVWPYMAKQRGGHVVNIIPKDQARTSALSLGMSGLSRSLAKIGDCDNILVNCVISSAVSSDPSQVAVSLPVLLSSSACPFQGATLNASNDQVAILNMVPGNCIQFDQVLTIKQLIRALDYRPLTPTSSIQSLPDSFEDSPFFPSNIIPLKGC